MANPAELLKAARSGEGDKLWAALRTQMPDVLECALTNPKLSEDMALYIANSKAASMHLLGALASDVRFRRSYKLQLTLVKNPRTPQRIVLSLLKNIKIFDLADISRNKFIPSVTRKKVELMLMERIPSMPAGLKSALSRRASSNIIFYIMDRSDRRVIDTCLESERLTEDMVVKALQRPITRPMLVRAVAEHRLWPLRQRVAYALVRHFNTPLVLIEEILPRMRTTDLRELYVDEGVPESTRPLIHSELVGRGVDVAIPPDKVYMVSEEPELDEDAIEQVEPPKDEYATEQNDESLISEYELNEEDEEALPGWELGCDHSEADEGEDEGPDDEAGGWDELG